MSPGGARRDKDGNLLTGRKATARGKKVPCNTKIYPDQAEDLKSLNASKFICEAIDEKFKGDTKMKPSNFTSHPWDSVSQKTETEIVARNIMVILKRTGDTFRPLSWEEYKEERNKEGGFPDNEKEFFEKVIGYCKSEDTANLFSPNWATIN